MDGGKFGGGCRWEEPWPLVGWGVSSWGGVRRMRTWHTRPTLSLTGKQVAERKVSSDELEKRDIVVWVARPAAAIRSAL
jgi:hypothetical protein